MTHSSGTLERELRSQPAALQSLIETQLSGIVAAFQQVLPDDLGWIQLAARGSSDNAARYAQALFGARNQITASLATPSTITLYGGRPSLAGALLIAISQSGASPDILASLTEAHRQGRPTVSVTNNPLSPLAQAADLSIDLGIGPETSVAATGTYTASCAVAAMLSLALPEGPTDSGPLEAIPEIARKTIDLGFDQTPSMAQLARYDRAFVVGRGYNYGTAFEVALKVKELAGVIAEPYSSADFRHGPIAAAGPETPVVLVAPSGAAFDSVASLAPELHQKGVPLIVISDDDGLLAEAHTPLPLPPSIPEWLSPIVAIIPGQILALTLAQARGLDPEEPTGLNKVTLTL